jgi:adenine deaminase
LLQKGVPADFIRIADLEHFEVLDTWINGVKVAENGYTLLEKQAVPAPNRFLAQTRTKADFQLLHQSDGPKLRVIKVYDGEIVTGEAEGTVSDIREGQYLPDVAQDLLYISVLSRYTAYASPAIGMVTGFGHQKGALASSVAHDSHNIVAVGTSDEALAEVVNAVIASQGGIAATDGANTRVLPLPIAGLMSQQDGWLLAREYAELDSWVKTELGCTLRAPFMSLSFLALPVIPKLKMTDRGLFDVEQFNFVQVEKASK